MSNVVLDKETFIKRIKKVYQNWKVSQIKCSHHHSSVINAEFHEIVKLN